MRIKANANRPRPALRSDALELWRPEVRAAQDDEATISIYDPIGDWDDEFGMKRLNGALRRMGAERDVTVNINSPGGDVWEGLAIYNRLREHKGRVSVNVYGIAASAASVVAMAGQDIRVGESAFLMIHNAWGLVIGNRHDLADQVTVLEKVDRSLADTYVRKSGQALERVQEWMDAETFFSGAEATDAGLADGLLQADEEETMTGVAAEAAAQLKAITMLENSLRITHPEMSRKERRALLSRLPDGTPSAAVQPVTPCADDLAAELRRFADALSAI